VNERTSSTPDLKKVRTRANQKLKKKNLELGFVLRRKRQKGATGEEFEGGEVGHWQKIVRPTRGRAGPKKKGSSVGKQS